MRASPSSSNRSTLPHCPRRSCGEPSALERKSSAGKACGCTRAAPADRAPCLPQQRLPQKHPRRPWLRPEPDSAS
eukprot:6366520-Pyramimonas_sp.AAC.1